MKSLKLVGLLLAAAVLGGCVYLDGGVGVDLRAEKVSLLSGEITSVSADTWSVDGANLVYEWKENGVPLDAAGATLSYSRFVTVPVTVTIEVTVRTSGGASSTSSKSLYVSPAAFPASLVVANDSPYTAYYLHVSPSGESSWGPDQMRPSATIPPGGSFVLQGIPAGSWDVRASGSGGSPVWTSNGMSFNQGESRTLHLY
jgi:hypothetical protein